VSSDWLSRFKHWHCLVFKKLVGESDEVSVKSTNALLESLPSLLEGYEPRDVFNADETGLLFIWFLKETWCIKEKLAMEGNIPKTDSLCYHVLIVMEVTNKC
jgi:hypothetical protein